MLLPKWPLRLASIWGSLQAGHRWPPAVQHVTGLVMCHARPACTLHGGLRCARPPDQWAAQCICDARHCDIVQSGAHTACKEAAALCLYTCSSDLLVSFSRQQLLPTLPPQEAICCHVQLNAKLHNSGWGGLPATVSPFARDSMRRHNSTVSTCL